jgi:CopG family transcriptional regulator / antitoxin EndoAI
LRGGPHGRHAKARAISLPPPLLKEAERVAAEENRSKSELLRVALRFYIETREVRRVAARDRLFEVIDRIQARTHGVAASRIRKLVREAVAAPRRGRHEIASSSARTCGWKASGRAATGATS